MVQAPKPGTLTAPGLSIEPLPGLQLPAVQDPPLPALASLGIAATRERCPLPCFGGMLLPRLPDDDAVFLADATLALRASRDLVGCFAELARDFRDPIALENGEHDTHEHRPPTIRARQILAGRQLALLRGERDLVELRASAVKLIADLLARPISETDTGDAGPLQAPAAPLSFPCPRNRWAARSGVVLLLEGAVIVLSSQFHSFYSFHSFHFMHFIHSVFVNVIVYCFVY